MPPVQTVSMYFVLGFGYVRTVMSIRSSSSTAFSMVVRQKLHQDNMNKGFVLETRENSEMAFGVVQVVRPVFGGEGVGAGAEMMGEMAGVERGVGRGEVGSV